MGEPGRILVVEDQPAFRRLLCRVVSDAGHDVCEAADGAQALRLLAERPFHLVLSDVMMPGVDGMTLLREVRARAPATQVVLITAYATIPAAVEAMRAGALDYLTKPLSDPDALLAVVDRALARWRSPGSVAATGVLVWEDAAMAGVAELVRLVAPVEATVLVIGESGVGKEVVARAIHAASPRAGGPFVTVDCAALPEGLLDSELFGHEAGAFTGAVDERQGRFEEASGGTLLLDGVADTEPGLQAKLLRVLQERTVRRVGGTRALPVDVRVIASSRVELRDLVAAGRFREDLLYRLDVVRIEVPPLRARGRDVLLLARHLLERQAEATGTPLKSLSAAAEALLLDYAWPGNVRELSNALERAALVGTAPVIGPEDLRLEPAADDGPTPLNLEELEKDAIQRALARTGGNRKQAAELLGISVRTLHYKLDRYDLR